MNRYATDDDDYVRYLESDCYPCPNCDEEGHQRMNEPELNFRAMIRHGRTSLGLSQRAAAERLGIDFTYVCKLETQAIGFTPSDELIGKMAALYDLPTDMLFVSAGKCPPDLHERMSRDLTFVTRIRDKEGRAALEASVA